METTKKNITFDKCVLYRVAFHTYLRIMASFGKIISKTFLFKWPLKNYDEMNIFLEQ